MSTKQLTAIYKDRTQALQAMKNLEAMGYSDKHISFLVSKSAWDSDKEMAIEDSNKSAEGAAIGAGIGGVAGAVVAGLTSVGAVAATGGVGLLAAGPFVAALTGAGAAGATGGVLGGLIGMGISETEAKVVDKELSNGSVMLGVETQSDKMDETKNILNQFEPTSVNVH